MERVNVNITLHRNHQSNAKKWRVNSVRMELQIVEKMVLVYPTLCKTISIHDSQKAEAILNKVPNNINKTYTGFISVLQGFKNILHEILATKILKGRAG